jgi:hypothetical protein
MNTPFRVCDTAIKETVKLSNPVLLIVLVSHHVRILFVLITVRKNILYALIGIVKSFFLCRGILDSWICELCE